MKVRNNDRFIYNAQNKLVKIETFGGDEMEYLYDSSGNRIRKKMKNSGQVVYNFDGVYDITKTPGQSVTHTLYFKGLYGDVFSQMTRNDLNLISGNEKIFDKYASTIYIKNRITTYYLETIVSLYRSISDYRVYFGMILLFILTGYALLLLNGDVKLVQLPTPIILTSYILLFASCGNFSSNKKGEAPWLLLANGITESTPSVEQPNPNSNSPTNGTNTVAPNRPNGNGSSSGGWTGGNSGGGSASSLVPPTGMFFLHPDHLGSINMISDGFGNLVTGGNMGGKSSINYKPYGEIHRTDSGGPDISKFKYTGQEEDKESGLMYYKARYYDPALGRFLQADSVVSDSLFGYNRYMYVGGNPMKFGDRGGNDRTSNMAWALMAYFANSHTGFATLPEEAAVAGWMAGHNLKKSQSTKDRHRRYNLGAMIDRLWEKTSKEFDGQWERATRSPNTNSKLYDKYIYAFIVHFATNGDVELTTIANQEGTARDIRKKNRRMKTQLYLSGLVKIVAGVSLIYFSDGILLPSIGGSLVLNGLQDFENGNNGKKSDAGEIERRANCALIFTLIERQRQPESQYSSEDRRGRSQGTQGPPGLACYASQGTSENGG